MNDRPEDFPRAVASLAAQVDVDLQLVVVGNGCQPDDVPEGATVLALPNNMGIPGGRNAGAELITAEFLIFLDNDATLPDPSSLFQMVAMFVDNPKVGFIQPRVDDPEGRIPARRFTPRLRVGDRTRTGVITIMWEGAFVVRTQLFKDCGGWPGHFWYGHEGIDLSWKMWDRGYVGLYLGSTNSTHPATSPSRHAEYFRNNARNRVWVAMRNLPAPLVPVYLATWFLITLFRLGPTVSFGAWCRGFIAGFRGVYGDRCPMRWRTVWRLSRAGRPPII